MDHWIWGEHEAVVFWLCLLMDANHTTVKKLFNGSFVEIKRGQLLFGLESFEKKTGVSIRKMRRYLSLMEKEGMIDRQKRNKYSLITIANYEKHQGDDRQAASERQADDKQAATLKNENNDLNGKKQDITPYQAVLDSYHEHLPMLPRVQKLTDARKRHIKARWSEVVKQGKDVSYFDRFFVHVAGAEDFLLTSSWCNLEWLMKEANFVKVIEGNYHNG
jgi:type II secretory pathway component PulJ